MTGIFTHRSPSVSVPYYASAILRTVKTLETFMGQDLGNQGYTWLVQPQWEYQCDCPLSQATAGSKYHPAQNKMHNARWFFGAYASLPGGNDGAFVPTTERLQI
jgi:hypothetical protein